MDLVQTEEQSLLQSTARDLVSGRSSLRRIRALYDTEDTDGFSRDLWREMAQLGWVGIVFPEEYGGAGLGYMDLMGIMEELGRGLMPEPMLSAVLLGGNALLLGGSDAQKSEHLPAIASGERLLALAYEEPRSRYRLHHVETRAETVGDGWRLQGEKIQVLDAHVSDWLVVSGRTAGGGTDRDGVTLFLIRADTPGVGIERQKRLDARNAGIVRFSGVEVGRDAVLGTVDQGGVLLERVIDRATAALTAEMLGSMSAAFEMTLDYLKTRIQFGVVIGTFQALKHRAARLYVETELARSAVMNANRVIDEARDDKDIARAASIAKARASDTFVLITNEAVQMHGGIGMTDEHDIGFFIKRARAASMTFGDAAHHRDRVARLDGY